MLSPRTTTRRIPRIARPLRPPSSHVAAPRPPHHHPHHPRPFTHTAHQHHLVSPAPIRPQLPFLSALGPTRRPLGPWSSTHLRQHFARLMATESRDYYRRRISRGLRIGLSFYAILVLFQVVKLGMYQEGIEHQWPTPPEWSWKSRWCLRSALALMHPEEIGKLLTNWPMVAGYLRELIERLETVGDKAPDGKGVREVVDGGFLVDGVGRTGLDVEDMSEPWRRGYFQALLAAAKAAENLDGWWTDRKQRISAPVEYVVGPSNPRPKPMPAGQQKVPREEDCEPASPSPESFYIKILTTKGFNTGQKLDAALAYADWLDYKGLQATADDMYTWAMDIAASGSSIGVDQVMDRRTGVLKNNIIPLPSENILRVSTALAVHHAKQGNLPTALSIFTSVLKARRSLPSPPPAALSSSETTPLPTLTPASKTSDPIVSFLTSLKNMFVPAEYPPPPPSGDTPPHRSASSICAEAALMTYIGEIIYASSSRETGLAWTRDAVDTAEAIILDQPTASDARTRCAECLKVGLQNWKTMVGNLIARAERDEVAVAEGAKSSWFGGAKGVQEKSAQRKRWEAEGLILDERMRRLGPVVEGEDGLSLAGIAPEGSLFV